MTGHSEADLRKQRFFLENKPPSGTDSCVGLQQVCLSLAGLSYYTSACIQLNVTQFVSIHLISFALHGNSKVRITQGYMARL